MTLLRTGAIFAILVSGGISTASGDASDFFPTNLGAHWEFKGAAGATQLNMTATITSSKKQDGKTVVNVRWTQNGQITQDEVYSVSPTEVARSSAGAKGAIVSTPPVPVIKFPLTIGKTWKWKGNVSSAGSKYEAQADLKVAALETLKTAAGTLKAFRVDMSLSTVVEGKPVNAVNSYWFAGGVGLVKQQATINVPGGQKIVIGATVTKYKIK